MATATKTATRPATRARTGPAASAARIDGRARFSWIQETRSTVGYQGEEAVVTHPRGKIFRGATLAQAVNLGIAAMPLKSGK